MEHKHSTSGIANKGAEPGSLPRASTGTAVMIHAPAEAGGGEAAWPPSIPQRREWALAARAHPRRVASSAGLRAAGSPVRPRTPRAGPAAGGRARVPGQVRRRPS